MLGLEAKCSSSSTNRRRAAVTLGCLLLILVAIFGGADRPAFAAETLQPGSWADLTQGQLAEYQVTNQQIASISDGYPDGLWKPYLPVTRAQFTKMAVTAFDIPLAAPATPSFADVGSEHTYHRYIEAAKEAGLVKGVTDQSFEPDHVITRQQAVAVMVRYSASAAGIDISAAHDSVAISSVLNGFRDGSTVAFQFMPEYAYAIEKGIVSPEPTGTLLPTANLNRLQCAALIIRAGESGSQLLAAATAPDGATRVQEDDSRLGYTGGWRSVSEDLSSGGTARHTALPGDQVEISFTGTRLVWVAQTGSSYGKVDVSVDGSTPRVVDLFSVLNSSQQRVFDTGPLSPGSHTVVMKLRSDRNSYSRLTAMTMDAVELVLTPSPGGSTTATTNASTSSTTATTLPPTTTTAPTTMSTPPTATTTTAVPMAPSTTAAPTPLTTLRPSTTTLAPTTTTKAPTTTTQPTLLAPSGALSVTDYGAKGDGVTDDRAALQKAINAAGAGATVYFPAGTYFMSQSSVFLNIPSNITLRGEGNASVLVFQDDGQDKRSTGLRVGGQTNVTIRDLKLMGTQANRRASVQLIRADGTNGLTLSNITFDGGEYALRTTGSSSWASNITVSNCRTLGNVLNPFFFAYARNIRVSGCKLEANRVDCISGRWPHHFYISDNVDGLYVSDCTLSGGQHVSITAGGENCTNLYFSDIVFDDVLGAIHCGGRVTGIHFDGVTLRSSRYWYDYAMVTLSDVRDFRITDFDLVGTAGRLNYLTEMWDCSSAVFDNGTMTNCEGFIHATPKGCFLHSGTAPTYNNVTVR